MFKSTRDIFYSILFLIVTLLVFLSRQIQVNHIKKYNEKFYLFNDPILGNPDSYFFLKKIKDNLLSQSNFLEKIFDYDLLTSIYTFLFYFNNQLTLPELIVLSSPFMVVLAFISIFIFFFSLSDKNLALFTSLSYSISTIFFLRSFVLFFDTDVLNIFFYFVILFNFNLYFQKDLSRNKFYLISLIFIFNYSLFSFHYPQNIFPIIYLISLIYIFFIIDQKKIDKIIIVFLFFLSTYLFYDDFLLLDDFLLKYLRYSSFHIVEDSGIVSLAESVSELKVLNIFEVEKILFRFNSFGFFSILSMTGIFFFLKNNKIKIILFLPFFVFLYGTFTNGIRYLIYCAPFIYFGFFYLLKYFFNYLIKRTIFYNLYFEFIFKILLIIFIWKISLASCEKSFSINCKQKFPIKSYFDRQIVKGILKLNNNLQPYNVITSPDYGYLIDYYTNVKSISDGGSFGEKNMYRFFIAMSQSLIL